MRLRVLVSVSALLLISAGTAHATVHVAIDLTHQRMHVTSAEGSYDWPISSARSGFSTPGGSYAPTHLERMHYSKKYHMSPMPYSIFFRGGFAIHGTYSTGELGRPASHGCVRLSPGNAANLYRMVETEGARISIYGTPASRPFRRERGDDLVAGRGGYRVYGSYSTYQVGGYGGDPYGYRYADPYGRLPEQAAPMDSYYGE